MTRFLFFSFISMLYVLCVLLFYLLLATCHLRPFPMFSALCPLPFAFSVSTRPLLLTTCALAAFFSLSYAISLHAPCSVPPALNSLRYALTALRVTFFHFAFCNFQFALCNASFIISLLHALCVFMVRLDPRILGPLTPFYFMLSALCALRFCK